MFTAVRTPLDSTQAIASNSESGICAREAAWRSRSMEPALTVVTHSADPSSNAVSHTARDIVLATMRPPLVVYGLPTASQIRRKKGHCATSGLGLRPSVWEPAPASPAPACGPGPQAAAAPPSSLPAPWPLRSAFPAHIP